MMVQDYYNNVLYFFGQEEFEEYAPYFYRCNEIASDVLEVSEEGEIRYKDFQYALDHSELSVFVTNMDYLFESLDPAECDEFDMKDYNTCNVVSMQHMFDDCAAEVIKISSLKTCGLVNTEGMFKDCLSEIIYNHDDKLISEAVAERDKEIERG